MRAATAPRDAQRANPAARRLEAAGQEVRVVLARVLVRAASAGVSAACETTPALTTAAAAWAWSWSLSGTMLYQDDDELSEDGGATSIEGTRRP